MGNAFTNTIYSIILYYEEAAMLLFQKQPPLLKISPVNDFEFGLTDEELQRYYFKRSLRKYGFNPIPFSAEYRQKASHLFESITLGIDISILSIELF